MSLFVYKFDDVSRLDFAYILISDILNMIKIRQHLLIQIRFNYIWSFNGSRHGTYFKDADYDTKVIHTTKILVCASK